MTSEWMYLNPDYRREAPRKGLFCCRCQKPIDAKSNGYVNVEVNYDTLEVMVHRFGKEVIGKDCLKKVLNEHNQTEKS
jgi:1,4-dihydroxy-2-naphthoyl-CoA synthase